MSDAPDDFEQSNVTEFVSNADNAELAARLYSPAIYARSGQVLFLTDFSKGFSGIIASADSASGTKNLSPQYSSTSGISLLLKSLSTNANDAHGTIYLPYVASKYYTIDMGYYFYGTSAKILIDLEITYEGKTHYIYLRHTYSPFKLEIRIADGSFQDITSLESSQSLMGEYNHVRATIDTETGLFKSIVINGISFDVSNISYYFYEDVLVNSIIANVSFSGNVSTWSYCYLQWIVISLSDV